MSCQHCYRTFASCNLLRRASSLANSSSSSCVYTSRKISRQHMCGVSVQRAPQRHPAPSRTSAKPRTLPKQLNSWGIVLAASCCTGQPRIMWWRVQFAAHASLLGWQQRTLNSSHVVVPSPSRSSSARTRVASDAEFSAASCDASTIAKI